MTLNYGNYGIFLIMGYAGLMSSTVGGPGASGLARGVHSSRILM